MWDYIDIQSSGFWNNINSQSGFWDHVYSQSGSWVVCISIFFCLFWSNSCFFFYEICKVNIFSHVFYNAKITVKYIFLFSRNLLALKTIYWDCQSLAEFGLQKWEFRIYIYQLKLDDGLIPHDKIVYVHFAMKTLVMNFIFYFAAIIKT